MINLRSIAFLLFFFSGFSALVYEVVWTRQLSAIFGSTTESVGVVLAVYMAGIALGGLLLGRSADRVKNRFLLFAFFEAIIGLYGLASPFLFGIIDELYYAGGTGSESIKILLSAAYMVIPCFFIGGTLPVLSRFCLGARQGNFGFVAGGLYTVNLFGAVLGAYFSGFWFLETFGIKNTLHGTGLLNLAVAACVVALYAYNRKAVATSANGGAGAANKNADSDRPAAEQSAETGGSAPGLPPDKTAPRPEEPTAGGNRPLGVLARIWFLLAIFLAGASTLGHEVLWTRILSQYFKNSIFSFAAMLMAVLISLAVGAAIGSMTSPKIRHRRFWLGTIQVLAGAASLGSVYIILAVPDLQQYNSLLVRFGADRSFALQGLFELLFALVLVFPAAFWMGMAFPLAANLAWRPARWFAGFVGDLQALFTTGNIAGALGMAFVLIPWYTDPDIGLLKGLLIVAGANWVAGLLMLGCVAHRAGAIRAFVSLLLVASCAALGAHLFYHQPKALLFWKGEPAGENLVFYRSGRSAEVAVVDRREGMVLKVNNRTWQGGTGGDYLETRLGLLPVLLKGGSDRALAMGLGTGNTLNGLLMAGAKDVDCVELIPEVVTASTAFHRFEAKTPGDGWLRIITGDARVFLHYTEDLYDLILGDLYFPWQSEAGLLYTLDHFHQVRSRLTDDGIFFQWLPLHQLRWEDFGVIGYTLSEVFEHVTVILASPKTNFPLVGIAGSAEPFTIDLEAFQTRLDEHPFKEQLAAYDLVDALEIITLYIGNEWLFRTRFGEIRVNTADKPIVEFRTARVLESEEVLAFNNFRRLSDPQFFTDNAVPILRLDDMSTQERLKTEDRVKRFSDSLKHFLNSHALLLRERILERSGFVEGDDDRKLLQDLMGQESLKAFGLAPEYRLVLDHILRLWQRYIQAGEITAANNLMAYALSVDPDNDLLYNKMGLGFLLDNQYEEAEICLSGALKKNDQNHSARANLAIAVFILGKRVQAREEIGRVVQEKGWKYFDASPLTAAMAELILKGRDAAAPQLERLLKDPMWSRLTEDALKSAAQSGREEYSPGKEQKPE